jgi:hypothetical protein
MDQQHASEILAACEKRREERRSFLLTASKISAGLAGASLLAACGSDNDPAPTPAPTPAPSPAPPSSAPSEADVLNFALNLEYLEAQFYNYAALGTGLPASQQTGVGVQGSVTGGQAATLSDPLVRAYAREIAADEAAHVAFLRRALGSAAVAMPAIDLSASPTGAFSSAARAAGLISGSSASFNPYSSDENFLLAAFLFEDVGPTAYKGAIQFLNNKTYIEAAAGIHAAEAYHAGLIRTVLYRKGLSTASLISATEAISNARDSLDGPSDIDQGITPTGSGTSIKSNIVPTDSSGIIYARTPGQVLNIVYLTNRATTSGGFFPAGVNGTLKTSAASA